MGLLVRPAWPMLRRGEAFLGRCLRNWTKEGLMSFPTSPPVAPSPFEIVRRSCLQQDGLPFADALTPEQMEQAFDAEGVSFGDGDP